MSEDWAGILLALGAAFAFALSSAFKHASASDAAASEAAPRRLVTGHFVRATLRHRLWWAGGACDVIGLFLQVLALNFGALAFVQPLLLSSLVFAIALRSWLAHDRVDRAKIGWAVLLTVALAAELVLINPQTSGTNGMGDGAARSTAWAIALVAIVCVLVSARLAPGAARAALCGVALGCIYAGTAALLKTLAPIALGHPLDLLANWVTYATLGAGLAGLVLTQLAFRAGPLTASLPAAAIVDPLASVLIGAFVFREQIRSTAPVLAAAVALFAVLVLAAIHLGQSITSPGVGDAAAHPSGSAQLPAPGLPVPLSDG